MFCLHKYVLCLDASLFLLRASLRWPGCFISTVCVRLDANLWLRQRSPAGAVMDVWKGGAGQSQARGIAPSARLAHTCPVILSPYVLQPSRSCDRAFPQIAHYLFTHLFVFPSVFPRRQHGCRRHFPCLKMQHSPVARSCLTFPQGGAVYRSAFFFAPDSIFSEVEGHGVLAPAWHMSLVAHSLMPAALRQISL